VTVNQLNGLHRLWRTLPRRFRQRVFHELLAIGVAGPASIPSGQVLEPVAVAGVLKASTGLGQAARLAVHAFRETGIAVRTFDLTKALRQVPTEPFDLGDHMGEGRGTLLLFATPPTVPLALRVIGRRLLQGKYRVGAWVCETQTLPAFWREQARWLHAIAAPSSFSQDAIASSIARTVHPLVHPVEAEPWPHEEEAPPRPPTVGAILDMGSSAARKNVTGITNLCRQLLARNAGIHIVLKVRDQSADGAASADLHQLVEDAEGRIELHTGDWSRMATVRFLDRLDLLFSLSRAEGFGLPIAEAMRRSTAVAAPFYAGPADYLDGSTAISLPFRLIDIADPSALYDAWQGTWADVDVSTAVRLVAEALGNRPAFDRMRAEARRRSRARFSSEQFVAQLQAIRQDASFGR